MALDSRDKRASALGIGLAFLFGALTPDGSISAADRQHIAGAYRGVLVAEATPSGDIDTRDKRASTLGIGLGFLVAAPVPDGALSAEDRQHIAGAYRAISAQSLSPPQVTSNPVVVRPARLDLVRAALREVARSASPRDMIWRA